MIKIGTTVRVRYTGPSPFVAGIFHDASKIYRVTKHNKKSNGYIVNYQYYITLSEKYLEIVKTDCPEYLRSTQ